MKETKVMTIEFRGKRINSQSKAYYIRQNVYADSMQEAQEKIETKYIVEEIY